MSQKLQITLATQNEGKRRELSELAKHSQRPVEFFINPNAPDVDETGKTFQENAILKARLSPPLEKGHWVLAEDSGLIIEALSGQYDLQDFPGIYTNRWLTRERFDMLMSYWAELPSEARSFVMPMDRVTENGMTNTELCLGVLALMQGQKLRRARYCCAMALWDPEDGLKGIVEKSIELWVTESNSLKGQNGFGYDPIMHLYDPATGMIAQSTMAEMSMEEKNHLSHRGLAFKALTEKFINAWNA